MRLVTVFIAIVFLICVIQAIIENNTCHYKGGTFIKNECVKVIKLEKL